MVEIGEPCCEERTTMTSLSRNVFAQA